MTCSHLLELTLPAATRANTDQRSQLTPAVPGVRAVSWGGRRPLACGPIRHRGPSASSTELGWIPRVRRGGGARTSTNAARVRRATVRSEHAPPTHHLACGTAPRLTRGGAVSAGKGRSLGPPKSE